MTSNCNTIIESLGVYLPTKSVSTREVLEGCQKKIRFPLEKISGIKSRHTAGETEFSIDLAKKAVAQCFSNSRYNPRDIDLLICSNICRYDAPDFRVSFEPSTSVKLRKHFGFDNALAFDIASACSGMFVAIKIVDAFIKMGMIRCGLVTSGEYISHIAQTAQKEIEGFLDPRLACLTLGDAGAAVILEKALNDDVGFHEVDLFTLGRYSTYCIAKPTDQEHGGAIMLTESLKLTNTAVKYGSKHALSVLKKTGWSPDSFQHLIMHQTSSTSLRSAMREINRLLRREICHSGNTIDNLADRGNTASTTHFVAVMDNILNNKIRSGDRVIFSISGSGETMGTALYTFDDLPDRLRQTPSYGGKGRRIATTMSSTATRSVQRSGIRIESWGGYPCNDGLRRDSMELLKIAALDCLERSSYHRSDIGLLIYAGVYRSEFISEPAIATLLAGELDINATRITSDNRNTLAFDVFNGSVGILNACHLAIPMILGKRFKNAMIVTADIENNAEDFPESLIGIHETGSALILEEATSGKTGFGNFLFRYFTDHLDLYTSNLTNKDHKAYLNINKSQDIERHYLLSIVETVRDLLTIEHLDMSQISWIFPPQISSLFISKLSDALNVSRDKFVDVASDGGDLFTSSFPCAWQYAHEHGLVKPGDLGLIVSVGSGIQVGCATYYF